MYNKDSFLYKMFVWLILLGVLMIFGLLFFRISSSRPRIKVLFIGNSFTSANDLPQKVSLIAKSLGDNIDYDMVAPGGYTLNQHSEYKLTLDKIKSNTWNYVVLQEQSGMPALDSSWVDTQVAPYAKKLVNFIKQNNSSTQVIFYETWGYENGDQANCSSNHNFCSYSLMQSRLNQSYEQLALDNSALLAPVGWAWNETRRTNSGINLYDSDGRHPSSAGTYLAACVFYEKIFRKNVTSASNLDIDPAYAKILQKIARNSILSN